jgi:leader peptidase (prepilin peptidase) / N-methyltransferase
MSAPVLALVVAACATLTTGWLLSWLPAPEEEPGLRFTDLDSPRFRAAVFTLTFGLGWLSLALTTPPLWPIWAPLVGLGTLLGLIDARTTFLPLRLHYLTLALVTLGALGSCWWRGDGSPLLLAATGGAVALAIYSLVWRFSGGQLGFGDVRLAGLLGIAAGATSYPLLIWCFLTGSVVGAIWAVAIRLRGQRAFAYGPSMLLGAPLGLIVTALMH